MLLRILQHSCKAKRVGRLLLLCCAGSYCPCAMQLQADGCSQLWWQALV
jgi:hypothetical protein